MSDIRNAANKSAQGMQDRKSSAARLSPVITIDGPSGSGKGTIASAVAGKLGYIYLDSGALYRLVALASLNRKVPEDDRRALVELAKTVPIEFVRDGNNEPRAHLGGQDVTRELRREHVGDRASRIATIGPLRDALLERQKRFRRPPGLVADGRDMGTVVFPDATLKVFLTASAQIRAERRYKQLIDKGMQANIEGLLADIIERDSRDRNRSVAPLIPAEDAISIDSSHRTIEEVVTKVLDFAGNRL